MTPRNVFLRPSSAISSCVVQKSRAEPSILYLQGAALCATPIQRAGESCGRSRALGCRGLTDSSTLPSEYTRGILQSGKPAQPDRTGGRARPPVKVAKPELHY